MADAAGLFGAREQSRSRSPRRGKGTGKAADRRDKLYPNDTVASQFLNPYGSSGFSSVPEGTLWKSVAKGNKAVMFHSELAADPDDEWRNSVGLSRTAQSIEAAIHKLKEPNMKLLLKETHYAKAMQDADALLPHVRVLNAGEGSEGNADYVGNLKSLTRQPDADKRQCTPEEAQASAKYLHKWLATDSSPLRGMLSVLAGDGCFWSGYASAKTARACALHKPMSADQMVRHASKRSTAVPTPAAASSDAAGLFGK